MDLEPKTIKVNSELALVTQAAEFEKQGRRVIDCSVFPDGIIGKLAFLVPPEGKALVNEWTAKDADAIWLTWEKFGRVLEPIREQVSDGNRLFELFSEHKDHGIVGYIDEQHAGFICFCKAKSEGKSHVFFVELANLKDIPPELQKYIPTARVVDPKSRG